MSDRKSRALPSLRLLTNLTAVFGLLLLADLLWAWWSDTATWSCTGAYALGSDSAQMLLGTGGLLLAMLGVMVGGYRHPLTLLGLFVMLAGLVASAMIFAVLGGACGLP